jgi:signal transduction histidine kinase
LYRVWVFVGFGLFCAAVVGLQVRHKAQLRKTERGQAVLTQQLILSQEDERKRIAGELHDGLAQMLIIIKTKIGLLRSKMAQNPSDAVKSLDELALSTSQAVNEVRTISQALRPVALEQVGVTGAIELLAQQASESSTVKFSKHIENIDQLLPQSLDINLYRIIQEGLSNVLKHAQATNVILEVKHSPGQISVAILDDGAGFDADSLVGDQRHRRVSLGLVGMTERAKVLGGSFKIQSAPGRGTRLDLIIPLKSLPKHSPGARD